MMESVDTVEMICVGNMNISYCLARVTLSLSVNIDVCVVFYNLLFDIS